MFYTQLLKNAVAFSIDIHDVYQKQKRKGKNISYITHPLTVGMLLAATGAEEKVIAAGILHDTVEDAPSSLPITVENLRSIFGERIANAVESVTEANKSLPWEIRKLHELEKIDGYNHDAILVKSADIISNVSELVRDFEEEGSATFERFNAPKQQVLRNYIHVINRIAKRWSDNPLLHDLELARSHAQAMLEITK